MPDDQRTTAAVQQYLNDLRGDAPVDPVVRELLARSVDRLQTLCASMLYRDYPRLTRPPLNLHPEEMLGALVERLLKALRATQPATVRQFFGLANQHMRWELNEFARRLDQHSRTLELQEELVPARESSGSELSPTAKRMLDAIEKLPVEEREVFELVRVQGMSHGEVADIVGTSEKTVQRRLNRGLVLLAGELGDLRPQESGG